MTGHVPDVLILTGPTGIGKSRAAVLVAEEVGGEIVNADSRQVYRGLEVGTAAPPEDLLRRVPHHLVSILDPREPWSAGAFADRAADLITDIVSRGRQPIVAGGSGLYLRALTEGLFSEPEADPHARAEVRERLSRRLEDEGLSVLRSELEERDPAWAAGLAAGDTQRVLRGLEVLELHGVPLGTLVASRPPAPSIEARWCTVLLERERSDLYARIDRRAGRLLQEGWLEEAQVLHEAGVPESSPGLTGLGYDHLYAVLESRMELDEAMHLIRRDHRRYAKRQMTWFRGLSEPERIRLSPEDGPEAVAQLVLAVWTAFRAP